MKWQLGESKKSACLIDKVETNQKETNKQEIVDERKRRRRI